MCGHRRPRLTARLEERARLGQQPARVVPVGALDILGDGLGQKGRELWRRRPVKGQDAVGVVNSLRSEGWGRGRSLVLTEGGAGGLWAPLGHTRSRLARGGHGCACTCACTCACACVSTDLLEEADVERRERGVPPQGVRVAAQPACLSERVECLALE